MHAALMNFAFLCHETAYAHLIKESNLISGKETEDNVNFNPRISSGHRPMAYFEAIREKTTNGWADGWADGWTDEQSYL